MTSRASFRWLRPAQTIAVHRLVLAALIAFAVVIAPAPAAEAQSVPAAAPPAALPSAAELEALAATIADEGKRANLLASIRGLIEARKATEADEQRSLSDRLIAAAEKTAVSGQAMLDGIVTEVGGGPGVAQWFGRLAGDPAARERLLAQLGALAVILAAGWTAELLVWRLLAGFRRSLSAPEGAGISKRLPLLVGLAVLDLVPLLGFAAAGYGAFIVFRPEAPAGVIAVRFLIAYVSARAILASARIFSAPRRPDLRVLPCSERTATYLQTWARRFVNVGIIGYFLIDAALLLGLPRASFDGGLAKLLGALLAVLAVVFILQNRSAVAAWLRGRDEGEARGEAEGEAGRLFAAPLRRGLAAVWHLIAIVYLIGAFVVWAWEIEQGFAFLARATALTAGIVALSLLLLHGLRRALDYGFAGTDGGDRRYPQLQERANQYLPYVHAGLRVLVLSVAALAVLAAWGVDVLGWLSRPAGSRVIGGVISVAVVAAGAVLIWEIANAAIENRLAGVGEGPATAPHRVARLRTLLPLMRKALFAVLTVMVALVALAEFGVNIGPLLAGAGIVGLAIGFGAQTLVKDIITGAFLLIEDALAVGDVVTVTGIGGVVEDLSIRSIRLRDMSGNVHTIPFSSVDTVTNMTKDFSYYLLDIAVAYREDTDQVSGVCSEIVDEMRLDPELGAFILEPLEVLGIERFAESAVILRARIKTTPIKQWAVGREFNRRMKKRFDALGIEMPFPHRTIYFGADKDGNAPPARVRMMGAAPAPVTAARAATGPADREDNP
jgi:small-conductance mechanosensitive channel